MARPAQRQRTIQPSPAPSPQPSPQPAPKGGVQVGLSSLITACVLLVAAIALAFVGGVMSGRSAVMRETAENSLLQDKPATPPERPSARAKVATPEDSRILRPEELHFIRNLRDDPLPLPIQSANPAEAAQEGANPAAQPQQAGQIPDPQNATQQAAASQAQQAQTGGLVDYVFQMAAFKDEDSVDALRQRLEGRGLRTRMRRDGKMYVVLVMLRGDASRAAEVVDIAKALRLGEPVVLSRKPVSQ